MGLERHEGEKWQFSFLGEPLTDACLGGKNFAQNYDDLPQISAQKGLAFYKYGKV